MLHMYAFFFFSLPTGSSGFDGFLLKCGLGFQLALHSKLYKFKLVLQERGGCCYSTHRN